MEILSHLTETGNERASRKGINHSGSNHNLGPLNPKGVISHVPKELKKKHNIIKDAQNIDKLNVTFCIEVIMTIKNIIKSQDIITNA